MNSSELQTELKKLDSRFSILENPNRPGLSNIYFDNKNYDLPVCSTHLIKEEVDSSYRYEFPNGNTARYWNREEIESRCVDFLTKFKEGKMNAYHAED